MIVYNLAMKVDHTIHDEWIEWQKNEHIPDTMATGLFADYKFFRLLEQDETDGLTYVIQYFAADIDRYQKYIDEYSSTLRKKAFARWGNRFITFHTVMQVVQ